MNSYSYKSSVISQRSRSGVTLLEILVVVAVMAMMATLVGGYYGSVTGGINIDNVANSIIYDLRNAQTKAMNGLNSAQWGICFRNPAGDDLYEVVSPALTCTATSSTTVISTTYLQSGVTFSAPPSSDKVSVIFNKITGVPVTEQTITITNGSQSRTINVKANGNIN